MSGHSKWATIHRAKEVKDSKRSAVFTKVARNITQAVRQGGGIIDPAMNFKLRLAIDQARQVNMPKDNINRAIEHGAGGGNGVQLHEVLFEGFAPGGVAILVSALTDNKLRTAQQIREVFDRHGGSLGSTGAVSYLFNHEGQLVVSLKPGKDIQEQELEFIDMGVTDLEIEGEMVVLYCHKDKTFEIKEKLEAAGYVVTSAELTMKPSMWIEVTGEENRSKIETILEILDELDDVDHVWSNYA